MPPINNIKRLWMNDWISKLVLNWTLFPYNRFYRNRFYLNRYYLQPFSMTHRGRIAGKPGGCVKTRMLDKAGHAIVRSLSGGRLCGPAIMPMTKDSVQYSRSWRRHKSPVRASQVMNYFGVYELCVCVVAAKAHNRRHWNCRNQIDSVFLTHVCHGNLLPVSSGTRFWAVADPAMGWTGHSPLPIDQNLGLVVAARSNLRQTRLQLYIEIFNFGHFFCMKMGKRIHFSSAPGPRLRR